MYIKDENTGSPGYHVPVDVVVPDLLRDAWMNVAARAREFLDREIEPGKFHPTTRRRLEMALAGLRSAESVVEIYQNKEAVE